MQEAHSEAPEYPAGFPFETQLDSAISYPAVRFQENGILAMNVERLRPVPSLLLEETPAHPALQHLVDSSSRYVPEDLTSRQYATLQAVLCLLVRGRASHLAAQLDASLAASSSHAVSLAPPPPLAFDCRLALDELDSIARTRAGYSFIELPPELQEAVLSLIASRDLTTRKLDLALWLGDFLSNSGAATVEPQNPRKF